MIIANIKDAKRYYPLHPAYPAVFEFLKALSEESTEGTVGKGYKVNFSGKTCMTSDKAADGSDKVFEAHRRFIDIHYCIKGTEGIGYADVEALMPITEYNEQDDYLLLKGEYHKLVLREGDFMIVYPEDAHIPMMVGDAEGELLKAVAKIEIVGE